MFGRNNFITVTVIKGAAGIDFRNPINSTASGSTLVEVTAKHSMRNSLGNKYKRQNVIKETFNPDDITDVISLLGHLGLSRDEFSVFSRLNLDVPLDVSDSIERNSEIVVINNLLIDLPKSTIAGIVEKHRIIPSRNNVK